jgi:mannosyltransferase
MSSRADASAGLGARRDGDVLGRLRTSALALDLVLVSGASLVLGLVRLGAPALWFDEAYTVRQLDRSYLEQFEGYQPFYYWIQKPWTALAGTSEWALRFPSVVGAMAASVVLVMLARKLFADRWVALLSGLFFATSPFVVKWSQQARVYPMLVAASLVATLLLLRALERGSRGAWAVYGIAYTLLLVWHSAVGLLLAPAHVALLVQRRARVLPHGLVAGVIVAAVGVPWVAQLAMRTNSEVSETAWIPYPSTGYVAGTLLTASGAAGVGLVLAVIGFWMLRRAGRSQLAHWLALWALLPFAFALVLSLARPVFLDRYLVTTAPAFAMLAAAGVMGLAVRARVGALVGAGTATVAALVVWYGTASEGNWRGEDWRAATAVVAARADEADEVLVVPWWAHDAAEYYGARPSDVSTADSLWVLYWSEDGTEIPADVRAPLGFGDHVLVEKQQFGWRVSAQLWRRAR